MNTMNKNGFTFVELIVAISIGLVITLAIYSLSEMGQRSSVSISQKVVTQQDARAVLDLMAMEIRMASYNPAISSTIWTTIPSNTTGSPSCTQMGLTAPVQGNKGIQIATTNTILIAMDLNADGAIGCNCGACCATNTCPQGAACRSANEYIMYSYDVNAGNITRNVSCGGNEAILGGETGIGTTIANNATNPAVNLFTYWGPDIDHPDANKNCADIDITAKVSSASTAARWIPQIRRVVITIVADTELADATTKEKRRMTYSTGVMVRNHVLSPPIPIL